MLGHIDGIDVNCGCPQGFAMAKGIGSGILRAPDVLYSLVDNLSTYLSSLQ